MSTSAKKPLRRQDSDRSFSARQEKPKVKWFHLYAILMLPSAIMPFVLIRLSSHHGTNPLQQQEPLFDRNAFYETMITSDETLIRADNTIVTAYFEIESKHSLEEYKEWMSTMLRLQDAMVIFTQPKMVSTIRQYRSHALNRTAIVPLEVDELPLSFSIKKKHFWQNQFHMDPERRRHKSPQLFWVWLSKSWLVSQAVQANVFQSDVFVWTDIGCFRNKLSQKTYKYHTMVSHREVIPSDSLLFVAHHKPNPPPQELWTNKLEEQEHFYHSSSIIAGNGHVWLQFHAAFLDMLWKMIQQGNLFVGEDQTVQQGTCLHHPDLCAYITHDQIKDNPFYGLRHVLHHGGTYKLWKPPPPKQPLSLMGPKDALQHQFHALDNHGTKNHHVRKGSKIKMKLI